MKQSKLLGLGTIALAAVMMTACGGDVPDPGNTTCDPACTDGKVCKDGQCVAEASSECDPACTDGKVCKDGQCVESSTDPCGGKCTGSQTCNEATGQCEEAAITCPSGQELCGSACADLKIDPDHCGSCDNACDGGKQCIDSACKLVCADGEDACEDGCHNLKTDANNCGECGKKCGDNEACVDGNCGVACAPGETACSGTCVNLLVNAENCGECGKKCGDDEACQNGSCAKSCAGGTELCGNDCIDLDSDANCGTCDNHPACNTAAGESCVNRECKNQCLSNQTFCNNNCVDLKSDKNNCGECGHACEGEDVCNNGSCGADCGSLMNCNGNCIDPKTSNDYCGAGEGCQNYVACGDGLSCQDGVCACANSGESICDLGNEEKICTDPQTSETYCGCTDRAAGVNCAALPGTATSECKAGVCEFTCDDTHADCNQDVAGCEADLNSVETCGACDNKCEDANADQTLCIAGACKYVCKEGTSECNNHCLDLSKDKDNCGWCGNKCADNAECVDGFCTINAECDDDGYMVTTINDQEIKAYCIETESEFRTVRDNINAGKKYPADNKDNAYILIDNLKLGNEAKWAGIGTSSNPFSKGYFIGNGKVIEGNLTVSSGNNGLFGVVKDSILTGFNLKINVTAKTYTYVGALAGSVNNSVISYSREEGTITNAGITSETADMLAGFAGAAVGTKFSYLKAKVEMSFSGVHSTAGIVGMVDKCTLDNCDVDIKMTSTSPQSHIRVVGALVGWLRSEGLEITDSKASGLIDIANVKYNSKIGGLVGGTSGSVPTKISNCISAVDVKAGNSDMVGGIIGGLWSGSALVTIDHSYASGNISGKNYVGGLVGAAQYMKITDSFATGKVEGTGAYVGGLVGSASNSAVITNCYATGDVVSAGNSSGGLAGYVNSATLENVYATGSVTSAASYAGGLLGDVSSSKITGAYATGTVKTSAQGGTRIGGLAGNSNSNTYKNIYAKGNVTGGTIVGGLIGWSCDTIDNCASFGNATCATYGNATGETVGSLIGMYGCGYTMTNCFALGDAKGGSIVSTGIGKSGDSGVTLRNVYFAGKTNGTDKVGAVLGRVGESGPDKGAASLAFKNTYYWESSSEKAIGYGSPATIDIHSYKYNENKDAVLTENDSRKLVSSLGSKEWVAATCKLPGGSKEEVSIPVPKALGADICK